jgi:lipopolysaccharide export system protein LptA
VRLTIERMRTLVLAAGILLLAALVGFLVAGKWRNPFNRRDIPKRLGIEIQQEANGVTYTQTHGGHTLFKLHASKVVQLKQGNALLHDVKIELYGEDGSRVDRIEGSEFEYDQKAGTAKATGPVEITLMRPGTAPAIAPKATPDRLMGDKEQGKPLASAAETAARGEVRVKTDGLTFDQGTGIATSDKRVEFSMAQGSGNSMGASYDSQKGLLTLDRAVELDTRRGDRTIVLHAQHAEFEREAQLCRLHGATMDYQDGQATAGDAAVLFREDGSAERLNAVNGFALTTASGGHLSSPTAQMEFDERNQPRHGRLVGGVQMDSAGNGRVSHGSAPTADLDFTPKGELRHAHLELGVEMRSEATSGSPSAPLRVSRTWRSPKADIEFRPATGGQVELATIHGSGGVTVTEESQRGKEAAVPSRLAADNLTGVFGPNSALTSMIGVGHAAMAQTAATGAHQSTSGDRLEAHFSELSSGSGAKTGPAGDAEMQIRSATVEGHVVLVQEPQAKPGESAPAAMRATAGKAVYEGAGEWLHLTLNPREDDGGLQLSADKIDVSQASGDAFAHGNVKATWNGNGTDVQHGRSSSAPKRTGVALGGQGPVHAISAEAQLRRLTGEATFRGQARLWQQSNSVAAPTIVLDREKQTLIARAGGTADPVRLVLVSVGGSAPAKDGAVKSTPPSVIRMKGEDLRYSDVERKAIMHGSPGGSVTTETGTATATSNEVELFLLPAGNRAAKDAAPGPSTAQVDRIVARGRVVVSSEGRRGTGEQLVYTNATGEYVLTGTAAVPPRMTDPVRGSVSGEALIFHGRDDSVSVEGGGRKTTTETSAPR